MRETCAPVAAYAIPLHRLPIDDSDLAAMTAAAAAGLEESRTATARGGIALVEDAAHALGGRVHGRALGTWGRAAAFSFHGTKNIAAGEGGMLVTMDADLASRAEIIREKGTDRSR